MLTEVFYLTMLWFWQKKRLCDAVRGWALTLKSFWNRTKHDLFSVCWWIQYGSSDNSTQNIQEKGHDKRHPDNASFWKSQQHSFKWYWLLLDFGFVFIIIPVQEWLWQYIVSTPYFIVNDDIHSCLCTDCDTDGDMMEEEGADSSSAEDEESACKCVYLSNTNCDSCCNIINAIEYVSV